jgi:hypothetical protein
MRAAEVATAASLAALSLILMIYATALPIGWDPLEGPGGGAFPFWLSLGMLVCAVAIGLRELLTARAPTGRPQRFIAPDAVAPLAVVSASLIVTVGLIHVVGTYVALPAFLLFYLRIVAKQSWGLTLAVALATPLVLFFFFEVTLKILLPKGVTEPFFIPLYAMFF